MTRTTHRARGKKVSKKSVSTKNRGKGRRSKLGRRTGRQIDRRTERSILLLALPLLLVSVSLGLLRRGGPLPPKGMDVVAWVLLTLTFSSPPHATHPTRLPSGEDFFSDCPSPRSRSKSLRPSAGQEKLTRSSLTPRTLKAEQ